jgi:hypothetical protein
MTDIEKEVFKCFCRLYLDVMNYNTKLFPSTVIATIFEISLYKARKIIKTLVNEGLLQSGCDSWYDDYCEQQIIARGYTITEKAKQTDIFKEAEEAEEKLRKEIWGF